MVGVTVWGRCRQPLGEERSSNPAWIQGFAVQALADRSADWVDQAIRDLEQAEQSMQADRHEWACFAAHQAVEKALKGLNLALGQQAWGHTLTRLWAVLPQ